MHVMDTSAITREEAGPVHAKPSSAAATSEQMIILDLPQDLLQEVLAYVGPGCSRCATAIPAGMSLLFCQTAWFALHLFMNWYKSPDAYPPARRTGICLPFVCRAFRSALADTTNVRLWEHVDPDACAHPRSVCWIGLLDWLNARAPAARRLRLM